MTEIIKPPLKGRGDTLMCSVLIQKYTSVWSYPRYLNNGLVYLHGITFVQFCNLDNYPHFQLCPLLILYWILNKAYLIPSQKKWNSQSSLAVSQIDRLYFGLQMSRGGELLYWQLLKPWIKKIE